MLRWERGTVIAPVDSWPGVDRVRVRREGPADADAPEELVALAYTELTGPPSVGETVLLNTNAVRRGLGTGGDALVVARPDVDPPAEEIAGHLMKARYTPLQTMVDAVDDPDGPHHALLQETETLDGMPVVVTDLHSAIPAAVAGTRTSAPDARIAVVHTDAAALPAAYSRTLAALRQAGLVAGVLSAGQSFGGDLEAVTVHSALLAARHVLGADVVVLAQGPGNLGSGTPWGFSGIAAAEAVHAVHVLGGRSVAGLRVSAADPRARHRGLSHHAATVFGRAVLAPVTVPLLSPDDPQYSAFHASVREQVESSIIGAARDRRIEHTVLEVSGDGLPAALADLPLRLSTMGRGLAEDAPAFLLPALAGRAAAGLIPAPRNPAPRNPAPRNPGR